MLIDKELQKQCREDAIKLVAQRRSVTQKYVREMLKKTSKDVYTTATQNAVKNWTVELYNKEMQRNYL